MYPFILLGGEKQLKESVLLKLACQITILFEENQLCACKPTTYRSLNWLLSIIRKLIYLHFIYVIMNIMIILML